MPEVVAVQGAGGADEGDVVGEARGVAVDVVRVFDCVSNAVYMMERACASLPINQRGTLYRRRYPLSPSRDPSRIPGGRCGAGASGSGDGCCAGLAVCEGCGICEGGKVLEDGVV